MKGEYPCGKGNIFVDRGVSLLEVFPCGRGRVFVGGVFSEGQCLVRGGIFFLEVECTYGRWPVLAAGGMFSRDGVCSCGPDLEGVGIFL